MARALLSSGNTPRHPGLAAPWSWAVLGALSGLAFALVLFAPASWLANAVRDATSGQLQLIDTRGTVWTGSGRLVLSGGSGSRGSTVLPGLVDWQLRPGWMSLKLQVSAVCCTPKPLQARLSLGWGRAGVLVSDGASQWPAAMLAGLGTPWNTVQAEGNLQLATQGLSVEWLQGRMLVSGQAELQALSLSTRLSTLKPMGSYRLTITGGNTTSLVLSTLEGSLQLAGTGRWIGSRLRFEGEASAAPEHEAALASLLNIIGRRSGARSIITLG